MSTTRVNEIDGLRFLAALMVVFFHYAFRGYAADDLSVMPYPLLAPLSKYGYLGVNLFFMISGFVILMSASSGSLRAFAVSRFVRLYPAFWACCTITFAAIVALGGTHFSATMGQYLANMTMLSGFFNVPSVDGAYWSLFVEIRFYALVALILRMGRIQQAPIFIACWLMASIALEIRPIGKISYLLVSDYSVYFISGATYYLIWSKGLSLTRIGMLFLSWGLAVFQALDDVPNFERHYNTHMNNLVVAGCTTSFFLVMYLVAIRQTGFWGRHRWTVAGSLTYPLYLLHQNIGFMVFNTGYPAVNAHLLFWSTLVGVTALAYAVHRFIERKTSALLKTSIHAGIDAIERRWAQFSERAIRYPKK